ncbi:sulfotransferase 1A1-like isoform X1 [Diadema antillarum]|uniref:sulfotransferase 1A1-like isoform X1 n=2 Tax=Diadema antillarum TaxID=105358 RepID=UPI003A844247
MTAVDCHEPTYLIHSKQNSFVLYPCDFRIDTCNSVKMTEASNRAYVMGHHEYKGIWYPNIVVDSSIEALQTFEVRPDDVWVVTYPKAGTHWMLEIVGLILSDGYPQKIDRSSSSTLIEMIDLDQKLPFTKEEEEQNPPDMTPFMEKIKKAPSPRVIQTHLRLKYMPQNVLKKAKVIYVGRNPKDTAVSWFKFLKDDVPLTWESVVHQAMDGTIEYGPWADHVKEFWEIRQHYENLLIVFYEDILRDPVKHIRMVAEHIGRPLSEELLQRVVENSSLSGMRKTYEKRAKQLKEPGAELARLKFISKGKTGQWKNYFTVAQNEIFDEYFRKEMEGVDIEIPFE